MEPRKFDHNHFPSGGKPPEKGGFVEGNVHPSERRSLEQSLPQTKGHIFLHLKEGPGVLREGLGLSLPGVGTPNLPPEKGAWEWGGDYPPHFIQDGGIPSSLPVMTVSSPSLSLHSYHPNEYRDSL